MERLKAIVCWIFLNQGSGMLRGEVAITINWQELRTFEQTELMVA